MIEKTDQGGIVLLRLAHGKVSALDLEFCLALERELAAAQQGGARAVVLTGTGRAFSAGVDLFRVVNGGEAYIDDFLDALDRAFLKLFTLPVPVIAAVNGHAIAGGCVLACACDHRVMSAGDGRIGVPELAVGVPFPTAALETMRFALPAPSFQRAAYLCETFAPDEALRLGIVDEVVDPSRLAERSLEIAQQISSIPPETFELAKRTMRAPAMRAKGTTEPEIAARWKHPDTLQAIGDYLERTLGRRS